MIKLWNLITRHLLGLSNIGKQKQLLQMHKTLVPNFLWLGKKMLNTDTFSSVKKNCHLSRTEHCPIWALSQDDLVRRERGACVWRGNEEMFLWQVDLREWQLCESAERRIVHCILRERGYWAPNGDRYGGGDKSRSPLKMYLQTLKILRTSIFGVMIFFLCSLICPKYWGINLLVASWEAAWNIEAVCHLPLVCLQVEIHCLSSSVKMVGVLITWSEFNDHKKIQIWFQ